MHREVDVGLDICRNRKSPTLHGPVFPVGCGVKSQIAAVDHEREVFTANPKVRK